MWPLSSASFFFSSILQQFLPHPPISPPCFPRRRSRTRSYSRSRSRSKRRSCSHSKRRSRSRSDSGSSCRRLSHSPRRRSSPASRQGSASPRRRESRSPSIRRRAGSPSHLDKRRITRWPLFSSFPFSKDTSLQRMLLFFLTAYRFSHFGFTLFQRYTWKCEKNTFSFRKKK